MAENIAASQVTPVETNFNDVPVASVEETTSGSVDSIAVEESSLDNAVEDTSISEHRSSDERSSEERASKEGSPKRSNPTRRRPRHNSKSRKSNQKSAETSKLPMVLFGIFFVLPLMQMMMWWIVGADPLGLAPVVGRALPVVPSSLMDEESAEDEAAAVAEQKKPKKKSQNILDPNIPHKLPTPNLDPDSIYIDDDK